VLRFATGVDWIYFSRQRTKTIELRT
jgi:hypothetical protein